jgi:esterase, PHB depolymerase family
MKMKLALLLTPTAALAATLEHITEPLASNPRNVSFYIYVPDNLPPAPPILVNPHWCHGSPQAAFAGSQFANLADRYGYIVIYPGSPNAADQCWDVSSKETLTHEGGGDSLGIVSMVKWTINRYGADAGRVFVTGVSSGAMMTQVLLGAYPDVFAAGASFAGVPFGCYEPENSEGKYGYWHDGCARGQVIKSAEEWGNRVRAAYPGYDGWRPKVALFHGTADEVVSYVNHGEAVKEWTNVLGLGDQPTQVVSNTPLSGWTKSVYGNGWLQAWSAQGVPHDIRVQENTVVEFFQLDCDGADCFRWGQGSPGGGNGQPGSTTVPSTRTSTSTSARPTTTTFTTVVSTPVVTPPPATSAQTLWGQW